MPLGRAEAIRLDGRLDDPAWETAAPATGFSQFEPDPGAAPSQRTEARVVYGEEALFVAIRAFDDDPAAIAGQLTRRDQSSYSDAVAVVIDSYYDRRTAFHFEVNPVGVQTDIYRFDDTGEDRGWDAVWESATSTDPLGWSAEFRIPYSQLRFREGEDQTWGINFLRRIAREEETVVWAPTSRDESAIVSRFGDLEGLQDVRAPTRMEITPYSLGRVSRLNGTPDDPFFRSTAASGAVGADVKYAVTGDLTLNLTLNPDFGQVEADPAQVNLSAFEVFLPERRPFFVEGSSLFNFGIGLGDGDGAAESLFYSRRVGRAPQGSVDAQGGFADADPRTTILGAWKLSGKTAGGWSIGLMNAVTAEESARIAPAMGPRHDQVIEPFSNYSVVRVARDFREGRSAVGLIATGVNREREASDALGLRSGAYTGGLDLRHRFAGDDWQVTANVLGSHIRGSPEAIARAQRSPARNFQRPDADHLEYDPTRTSLSGFSAFASVSKFAGGRWRVGSMLQTRSPGFEVNDAGFMREADYVTGVLFGSYVVNEPMGPFRQWRVNSSWWSSRSWGWENTGFGGNVNGNVQLENNWRGYTGVNVNAGGVSTGLMRGGPAVRNETRWSGWGGLQTDSRRAFQVDLNLNWNRAPESDSWGWGVSPTLRWRPSARATLSAGSFFRRNVNDLQWVGRYGDAGEPLFGRIDQNTVGLTGRFDFAFSPTLSLQLYAQPFVSAGTYTDFKRVADPRARAYADRIAPVTLSPASGGYEGDVDGDGLPDQVGTPDFNIRQFRSNAVLRWEYRPGSALFLVWAQGRQGSLADGSFHAGQDLGDLFRESPEDVFMIKVSYWINP
ncbi:MAG: DUF5916 domain-containing protein [Gemmatimonadota bacterium]